MYQLSKRQKNELFEIVEQREVNHTIFSWGAVCDEEYPHRSAQALMTKIDGRNLHFSIDFDEETFYVTTIPTLLTRRLGTAGAAGTWSDVKAAFFDWVDEIRYEAEEPDLWAAMKTGNLLTEQPATYADEERFSATEVKRLREELEGVKRLVLEQRPLAPDRVSQINQTFIYLGDQASKQTKLSWKNIFAGTMIAILHDYAKEQIETVVKYCGEHLGQFFRHLFE